MVGEVANWCLANGLTAEQADRVWDSVKTLPPPSSPSDFIQMMEFGAAVIR